MNCYNEEVARVVCGYDNNGNLDFQIVSEGGYPVNRHTLDTLTRERSLPDTMKKWTSLFAYRPSLINDYVNCRIS